MNKFIVNCLILLIFSCQSNTEPPTQKKEIDLGITQTDYSKSHKIDGASLPFSFSEIREDNMKMFPTVDWVFSRTDFSDIKEISDSTIIHSDYNPENSGRRTKGTRTIIQSIKVKKGQIIFAVSYKSLNDYYAIKILDSNENGVKLEYKLFKTKEIRFERYTTAQAIRQIAIHNDLETLSKLSIANPSALNRCMRIDTVDNTNRNLIMYAIEYEFKETFEKLLSLNVDIENCCYKDVSLLLFACRRNKVYFVERLLSIYKERYPEKELDSSIIECIKKRKELKHLLTKK